MKLALFAGEVEVHAGSTRFPMCCANPENSGRNRGDPHLRSGRNFGRVSPMLLLTGIEWFPCRSYRGP
jgi:hypothetical protein